jgi:hypothetical protein
LLHAGVDVFNFCFGGRRLHGALIGGVARYSVIIVHIILYIYINRLPEAHYRAPSPTIALITVAMGGMDVKRTVTVPNKIMERLERAAALGSVRRRRAVAMALELTPSVMPLATYSSAIS